ncbi:MAG: hypothetical protein HJJLKODD_01502 [Phycisphaerae bacterium]|nr:hypothetical protein [Phycisphaerae bacterium]
MGRSYAHRVRVCQFLMMVVVMAAGQSTRAWADEPAAALGSIADQQTTVSVTSLTEPDQSTTSDLLADLEKVQQAFVQLAEKTSPSVVAIETRYDAGGKIPTVGSGVILTAEGLILTNDHVVRDGVKILVTVAGGHRHTGRLVGRDARSDLAVIDIDAEKLQPARLGDLAEVRVGQWALAMGNPFGLARDGQMGLSYGIVSGLGKSLKALEEEGKKYYGNLIQTTADINPGNSGGPLFNIRGEVIGINTAIETTSGISEGLGFAIPIDNRTRTIVDYLRRGESVPYGFLGVNVRDAEPELLKQISSANPWGVVVTRVYPATPAETARLQERDLIVQVESQYVQSPEQLVRLVSATPAGQTISLLVYRENKPLQVQVTLADLASLAARDSQ